MQDPAAPAPETPKPFCLPPLAWIFWAVGAVALASLSLSNPASLSAHEHGRIIGAAVGLLLFPTLAGWVVWRVARRSHRAGLAAFYVVLALSFSGQLMQGVKRHNSAVLARNFETLAQESKAEMQASLDQNGMITAESQNRVMDKALTTISTTISDTKGEERETALAMQAFMNHAKAVQERQAAAMQLIQVETIFDLSQHATAEQRTRKRAGLEQLKATNVQMRDLVANSATWIERELQRRKVSPAMIKSVLAGYGESADRNRSFLLPIRDLEDSFADLLGEFITFAETHEGQWSVDAETANVMLPNDEAVAQYNDLLSRAQEIGAKQVELQRQLYAP